jgi:predicted RNA-binding protein with RPS1 domain
MLQTTFDVRELAFQLGMTHAECLDLCAKLGVHKATPFSPVTEPEAETVGHHAREAGLVRSYGHYAVDDLGGTFADAIDATMVSVEDGAIVSGTVVRVDRDEVLLDIGYKSEGVIPSRELSIRNDVDPSEVVSLGDHVEALVLTKEDKDGRLILSKKRILYERAWGGIERVKDENGIVSGPVIEVVDGGLILDIGLRGFLPASLVELRQVHDLQPYVGKSLEAKIIELDKNRNNVVLSRRAWLEERRRQFLVSLMPGEVRRGVVSQIVNFGVYIQLTDHNLDEILGYAPLSELSWKQVDHPGSVVAVGDEVEVQVLDVDLERERISLSLKQALGHGGGARPAPTTPAPGLGPAPERMAPSSDRPPLDPTDGHLAHLFISYAREDQSYVTALVSYLGAHAVPAWTDVAIQGGEVWRREIERAIGRSFGVLVVMTPSSAKSTWVERELTLAETLGRPILPLLLDGEPWWDLSHIQFDDVRDGRMPSRTCVSRLHGWRDLAHG